MANAVLPDEMLMEVLLRLPVKSILRFRAVCRSWAALLSSEEFCGLHMANKAEREPPEPLLLYLSSTQISASTGLRSSNDGLLLTLKGVRGDFAGMTPVPCRGLTLLHDALSGRYYLLNAATRAVAQLPPPCQSAENTLLSTTGLGFDATTGRYKVVRLFSGQRLDDKDGIKREVYSPSGSGADDRWRPAAAGGALPSAFCELAVAAMFRALRCKLTPVFADGFLHWLIDPAVSCFATRPEAAVLSFSLADETFSWFGSPPFDLEGAHLAELDGSLCMVRDLRRDCGLLEIWRVKDYYAGDWSLEHRIDLARHAGKDLVDPQNIRVVGSCRAGKRLIFATSRCKVIAYDPMSATLETILELGGTRQEENRRFVTRVGLLKESLAPVR